MPRQIRNLSETKLYHIMLRGNEKKDIFLDNEDRLRFINTLRRKANESGFKIYSYCLMSNHVHLVLNEGSEGISKVMKRINVSYAYYFNKKYKRVGHLFQDRYKSEAICDERYLLSAIRYVHNNPVRAGIVSRAEEYIWSSYKLYIKGDKEGLTECAEVLQIFSLNYFRSIKLFIEFTEQFNSNEEFIDHDDFDAEDREKKNEIEARRIIAEFLEKRKIEIDVLKNRSNAGVRNELIIRLRKDGRFSIRKIADFLGLNRGVVQLQVKGGDM